MCQPSCFWLPAGVARLVLGLASVAPLTPHAAHAADTEISTAVGPQTWTSDDFLVTSAGAVDGGGADAITVTAPGGGTLTNQGTIIAPGQVGISTVGAFGAIVNSGTISDTSQGILIVDPNGGTFNNTASGSISGSIIGVHFAGTQISEFTNAGLISGDFAGLYASDALIGPDLTAFGTIGVLNNSGTITSSGGDALSVTRFTDSLINSGTISSTAAHSSGIYIGQFGQIVNEAGGRIMGNTAIHQTDFDTLINRGDIIGTQTGLSILDNGRSRTLIQNDGLISGGDTALDLTRGHIGALVNNGTISSEMTSVIVGYRGLDELTNNGLIHGDIVLEAIGDFPVLDPAVIVGAFTNSGTIEGDIIAKYGATLTINGGTDKRGVLTGLGGAQGLINTNYGAPALPIYDVYNAVSQDLTFGSGLLLLNDTIFARNANVHFAGANVQINNEVGVTGHVILSAGDMVFGVTAPDTYGHYVVTGDADLDAGAVSLVALGAPVFAVGQSYHVLSADNVTAGAVTTSVEGFDTSYAILDMGGSYDFVVSIDGIDEAYNELGFTAGQMLLNGSTPVTGAITTRQDDLVAALGQSGVAAGSDALHARVWGKILRANADRETAAAATGYSANGTGLVIGADMPLSDTLDAGLALSWLRDIGHSADRLNGTDATIDSYQTTAYGTWRPADRVRIDGQFAYGLARINQHRYVSILSSVADADYDGDQLVAGLTASYAIPLGASASLTPYAGLRAVRVTTQSYREQGAGVANLSIDEFSAISLRHDIGVKLGTQLKMGDDTITSSLRLGWLHEYRDTPLTASGTFSASPFTLSSARVASNGLAVGLNVDLVASDSFSIGLGYDGEYRSDYQSHTGAIRADFSF
tara:strand:- start:5423 stop:8029 length:2607 start_codon:yes stop_codon:yes gene_type:complete